MTCKRRGGVTLEVDDCGAFLSPVGVVSDRFDATGHLPMMDCGSKNSLPRVGNSFSQDRFTPAQLRTDSNFPQSFGLAG